VTTSVLPVLGSAVRKLAPALVANRREFHQHPELSWEEYETQRRILERLNAIAGLEDVRPIARTGATALLRRDAHAPVVLWRADIDALPVPEQSGLPFASQNAGVMHACGHDAHIAIALGLAELLAAPGRVLPGTVRFVFQPAEEACGGSDACIADGVLDHPLVQRALGLHISADVPIGSINVAPGPFFAAPTAFTINIKGRGGHAAAPHQSVDSVVVAAHVITALQTVASRSVPPLDTVVLTVGKVEAGYRGNVIAPFARLQGTIRTYTDEIRQAVLERADRIIAGVCAAFEAEYTFAHDTTCPPLVNDPHIAELVAREAQGYFGPGSVLALPSMGAEDMSVFLRERPGCYFWLGARNEGKGIAGRHHDAEFAIDEDALAYGVEFAARIIEANLRDLAQP
jgi:amidohydrolase